jgi:hypothetical protein
VHRDFVTRSLITAGWCFIEPPLVGGAWEIVTNLGPIVRLNDKGDDHRDLVPYKKDVAPRGSMSAITGTDEQPMHTDAAYLPLPPRYIVLYCLEPGEGYCPTLVWVPDLVKMKIDKPAILSRPRWVFRGGGHRAFYSSIMGIRDGEPRIRFDPFCMRATDGLHGTVEEAGHTLGSYAQVHEFVWQQGALLAIDNWRCLHSRGRGADKTPSRKLRRWAIGACDGLVG